MSDDSNVGFPGLDTPFVEGNESKPGAPRNISIPWYRLLVALWNRTGGGTGNAQAGNQPGMYAPFAGPKSATPDGYLFCDGASYAVAAFPNLFSVIGYSFGGAGDSFRVPNCVDRVAIGAGLTYPLGALGGAAAVNLQPSQIPSTLSNAAAGGGLPVIGAGAAGQAVPTVPPYFAASWIIKT